MRVIEKTFLLLGCVFLAWVTLSYFEIISKNIFGGATYSDFNIIVNLTNYFIPGGF